VLNRREFNAICVALGSVVTSSGLSTLDAATDPTGVGRSVKFRDGTVVSALGQGSARLAHGRRPPAEEEEALRTGLSLGMTLIDTAEVPYNLGDRAIERDLLPWCEQHGIPIMAYSPLGGPGASLLRDSILARIAAAHGCSPAAVALAWTIRNGHVIAIPESGSVAHVKENAIALSLTLSAEEFQALDAAHPAPGR
jgi:diketogulonate reductase-like aldo/keto reductase